MGAEVAGPAPRISVVIPTIAGERAQPLTAVLQRLAKQTVGPEALEVVVAIDPGAAPPALPEVPLPLRLLASDVPGVSAKRNRGWQAARAPLVLFLGDDIVPAHDLVAEHLARHERHPEEAVGVLGHVRWADSLPRDAFLMWLDENGLQFDYDGIGGEEAGWGRFYTANVSLKRALLQRVDGFDETFPFGYEDLELAYRMHAAGLRLLYHPAACAEHLHRPTLAEWRARMAHVGRAERRFVEMHPEIRPYFRDLLEPAAATRPRGRGARLADFVPRSTPWVGPRVRASADAWFRAQLAEPFLAAWEEAGAQPSAGSECSPSSGGSPPGGPK